MASIDHASAVPASPAAPRARVDRTIAWLDEASDRISPIVVKEIRQIVRGREFNYSFVIAILIALVVAFFGANRALAGVRDAGAWVFAALTTFLALLGLTIVPLGAFSGLRNERLEQTLDLISVTALSPRAIVTGKLLAQGVKLVTLFAVMAPFVAMSFLLGGIDVVTILAALFLVFLFSMWASAAALFLSSLLKSRALSGAIFGALAVGLFAVFGIGRLAAGSLVPALVFGRGAFGPATQLWWTFAAVTVFGLSTMANFVLLAESRLAPPSANTVTPLRVGFLLQFLFILVLGWALLWLGPAVTARPDVIALLTVFGGAHLALVAVFAVTEDLASDRGLRRVTPASRWGWLLVFFRPGGSAGAAYVLVQMAGLLAFAWMLGAGPFQVRRLLATCGYICLFTGLPALALYWLRPFGARSLHVRVGALLLLAASLILPDVIYVVFWRPETIQLGFSARHTFGPLRALFNWDQVEMRGWELVPMFMGSVGFVAYVVLLLAGLGLLRAEPPVASLLTDRTGGPADDRASD